MATRTTDERVLARFRSRRSLEPSLYTARAAGLYSEVVWDRSWAVPDRTPRSAPVNDASLAAPGE